MRDVRKKSENDQVAQDMLASGRSLTRSADVLSEVIDTDVRDNLPPQMLAVITAVFRVIEDMDGRA